MIDGQPLAVFQPFIDTATGRVAGVESLARLKGADGILRSAGPLFVDPQINQSWLRRLDRAVRDNALSRIHEAPEDWFFSINISPRWISRLRPQQALPSLKQLAKHGINPNRIVFEITELCGANQRLVEAVAQYRAVGGRIAVDDFGAGHSQLDRVLALRPDILKLDMRLFKDAAKGGPSYEVVRALAQMAEKTGCWIIAEGVETEDELHFALECGARYVQGFIFSGGQPHFFAPDAFSTQFATLRDHYVQNKLSGHHRSLTLHRESAELMAQLKTWAETPLCPTTPPPIMPKPWLLRIYLCDRQGTQITPNFQWENGTWHCDPQCIAHNWSWRPYFHQLLAGSVGGHRLTLSPTYRDANTNQYCLTAGQMVSDGNRLLLLDIDAAVL